MLGTTFVACFLFLSVWKLDRYKPEQLPPSYLRMCPGGVPLCCWTAKWCLSASHHGHFKPPAHFEEWALEAFKPSLTKTSEVPRRTMAGFSANPFNFPVGGSTSLRYLLIFLPQVLREHAAQRGLRMAKSQGQIRSSICYQEARRATPPDAFTASPINRIITIMTVASVLESLSVFQQMC